MATAEQIKALVRSIKDNDEERFYNIALQVASSASKKGQSRYASDLKTLIDKGRDSYKRRGEPSKIAEPKGELADIMYAAYPEQRLSDVMLPNGLDSKVKRIILEQRQRQKLYSHSLRPKSKILLAGESGTGKTLTASMLASELQIPLFVIKFEGLISKYLGETAAKLRMIFDQMHEKRGVYLFDEFDAVGTQRSNNNDVGEARRIVSSLLQFIEQDDSDSLIVAATNHKGALDEALFRRFDDILTFEKPDKTTIKAFINNIITLHGDVSFDIQWEDVIDNALDLSFAEIELSIKSAIKLSILKETKRVDSMMIAEELKQRK
ncbi:MAG: hypothetical protein CMP47_13055 [Rickettsiales bacterium]|nr:hypothetical protein [Rickettsiales bacterium]